MPQSSINVDGTNVNNNENGDDDVVEDEYATELESDRKFRLVYLSVSLAGYRCPPGRCFVNAMLFS